MVSFHDSAEALSEEMESVRSGGSSTPSDSADDRSLESRSRSAIQLGFSLFSSSQAQMWSKGEGGDLI